MDRPVVAAWPVQPRHAVEELYYRHRDVVERVVRSRLRGSSADMEDVVQNVWLAVVRAHSGFRGESSVRTWLIRIAVNAVSAWHRRERYRRTEPLECSDAALPHAPREEWIDVTTALASLSPRTRAFFVWHDAFGIPRRVIAAHAEVSLTTVSRHLAAARRDLSVARGLRAQRSSP